MPKLHVRFSLAIKDPVLGSRMVGYGPLFQGWCPASEKDAVTIAIPAPGVAMRVWFQTKVKKRARKSEVFWAGPLTGQLDGLDVSAEEANCIRGAGEYRALGRRVVILLSTAISAFVDALRGDYGQYWVPPVRKWDSRHESLSDFCSRWQLDWSLDDDEDWFAFVPENVDDQLPGPTEAHQLYPPPLDEEYITKADWTGLGESLAGGYKPSLASAILSQAHGHCDQANLRLAFLEGVSALEVAIGDYLTSGVDGRTKETLQPFLGISLAAQVTAISLAGGAIPLDEVAQTVEAIRIRNKVAHDGFDPPTQALPALRALLLVVSRLLKRPSHKFPRARRTLLTSGPPQW